MQNVLTLHISGNILFPGMPLPSFSILIPYQSLLYSETAGNADNKEDNLQNEALSTERKIESALKSISKSILKNIPKDSLRILIIIADNPEITMPQIGLRMGLTRITIAKKIKKLQEAGLLRRQGATNGGHWEVVTP